MHRPCGRRDRGPAARGTVRSGPAFADDIDEVRRQLGVDPDQMPETSGKAGAPANTEEDVR